MLIATTPVCVPLMDLLSVCGISSTQSAVHHRRQYSGAAAFSLACNQSLLRVAFWLSPVINRETIMFGH
jgi:hypothetical protein